MAHFLSVATNPRVTSAIYAENDSDSSSRFVSFAPYPPEEDRTEIHKTTTVSRRNPSNTFIPCTGYVHVPNPEQQRKKHAHRLANKIDSCLPRLEDLGHDR